ncbi:methyltransferase domain-containing protein [bacterium]|nr:methyltransferase domain-containing protein [bacterium]
MSALRSQTMQQARINMVSQQLATSGITDKRILDVMGELPREPFIPAEYQSLAYADHDLPLGHGLDARYLLEPLAQARLLQLAEIDAEDTVLDVGCATGYSAALASHLARHVVALECNEQLAAHAVSQLRRLGRQNVEVTVGSLAHGVDAKTLFDAIIINGGAHQVPQALEEQLKEGGRIAAIIYKKDSGRFARMVQGVKADGVVTYRDAYDAAVRVLPGLEKHQEFVF